MTCTDGLEGLLKTVSTCADLLAREISTGSEIWNMLVFPDSRDFPDFVALAGPSALEVV